MNHFTDEYRFHRSVSSDEPDFIELPTVSRDSVRSIARGREAAHSGTHFDGVWQHRSAEDRPPQAAVPPPLCNWIRTVRNWFSFEKNTGYAISVIAHAVVLVILSLWAVAGSTPRIVIHSSFSSGPVEMEDLAELLDPTLTVEESDNAPDPTLTPPLDITNAVPAPDIPAMLEDVAATVMAPTLTAELVEDVPTGMAGGEPAGGSWGRLLEQLRRNGLDVVLTFDSTGSMQGEIESLKSQLSRIGRTLQRLVPGVRIGICTYRDQYDDYVVKSTPLTTDIEALEEFLDSIHADGGGDVPEAVLAALGTASRQYRFRPGARKVILLFGDAPPHDDELHRCIETARSFHRQQSGVVCTIACRSPIREFQLIADAGGGEVFMSRNERDLIKYLLVLVFGSEHRKHVEHAFGLGDGSE